MSEKKYKIVKIVRHFVMSMYSSMSSLLEHLFFGIYPKTFCGRLFEIIFWNYKIVRQTRCFVLGHYIVTHIEWYEKAYCKHCGQDYDIIDKQMTIPLYLNNFYCWLVDQDWKWFEILDLWLLKKFSHLLPKWWEY